MVRCVAVVVMLLAGLAVVRPPSAVAQAVADLEVTPQTLSVVVGERKEVLATAYDRDGDIASVSFQWTSSNVGVAMIEEEPGLPGVAYVIGVTPGSASVEVRAGGRTASLQVAVGGGALAGPAGTGKATILQVEPTRVFLFPTEDLQLRLIFLKDDGSPAAPEAVQWRSFRPEVATVDGSGRVVGLSDGTGLVEASTNSGLTRRVQVQVGQAEWSFALPVVSLSPALSDTVRAIVPSQGNRAVPPRALQWGSTNRNVATVTPLGVVTAIAGGQAELVVVGFGQEHRLPVTVHREVEGLSVLSPPGDTIVVPLGGPIAFKATALAVDDTPVPQAPLIWLVGDTSIATYSIVDTAAIGKGIGMTSLTVRAPGGLEKTWTLNVVAAGLVLEADRLGMGLGDERTLIARFADDLGRPLAQASGVSWSSSNPEVARVNADGHVTGTGIGRADIDANTPWGVSDTAAVFIQGEIVFSSNRAGTGDLYGLDRDAPDQLHQITEGPGDDFSPAYSPDGSRIAFVSNRAGNFEVYLMDADGGNLERLTDSPATEGRPSWTPDGRQIVYTSGAAGGMHIWIMNADGSGQRQLTAGEGVNLMPAVSPDGRRIAFASARAGNYDIFVMGIDGSDQQSFTSTAVNESVPAWMSDTVIAFVREERRGRITNRTVVAVGASGEATSLTGPQYAVVQFAVSPAGVLLAAIVGIPGETTGAQRLVLLPVGEGAPVEVSRVSERELQFTPAFRR
jgi:uncharacterized protein YjdB